MSRDPSEPTSEAAVHFFAMYISQNQSIYHRILFEKDIWLPESYHVPFVEDPLLLQGPDTCKKA